jgi:hypothetical protein
MSSDQGSDKNQGPWQEEEPPKSSYPTLKIFSELPVSLPDKKQRAVPHPAPAQFVEFEPQRPEQKPSGFSGIFRIHSKQRRHMSEVRRMQRGRNFWRSLLRPAFLIWPLLALALYSFGPKVALSAKAFWLKQRQEILEWKNPKARLKKESQGEKAGPPRPSR